MLKWLIMNKIVLLVLMLTGISITSAAQPKQSMITVCSLESEQSAILVGCGDNSFEDGFCTCYILQTSFNAGLPNVYDGDEVLPYDTSRHGELRYIPLERLDFQKSAIRQLTSKDSMLDFKEYRFEHEPKPKPKNNPYDPEATGYEDGDGCTVKNKIIVWELDKNNPHKTNPIAPNEPQLQNQSSSTDKISTKRPIKTYTIAAVICAAVAFAVWWLQDDQVSEKKIQ